MVMGAEPIGSDFSDPLVPVLASANPNWIAFVFASLRIWPGVHSCICGFLWSIISLRVS